MTTCTSGKWGITKWGQSNWGLCPATPLTRMYTNKTNLFNKKLDIHSNKESVFKRKLDTTDNKGNMFKKKIY